MEMRVYNKPSFRTLLLGITLFASSAFSGGSIQNQTMSQAVPIVGTGLSLHYTSDRMPGHLASNTITIPLTGSSVPAPLKGVILEITIAGQKITKYFGPSANQKYQFTWDGKDAFGRFVGGKQKASIRVGYIYDLVYKSPSEFGNSFGAYSSGQPFDANRSERTTTIWQESSAMIGRPKSSDWTFANNHIYEEGTVFLGWGSKEKKQSLGNIITTVAGNGQSGFSGDGGRATEARLNYPQRIAVSADGSLYIADEINHRIRKVSPDGTISTVAGNGQEGFSGDGGRATEASLRYPDGIAVGIDGSLYIADNLNFRIRKVSPDGVISTIAGNGQSGFSGDGGRATEARLLFIRYVTVGADGSLYIADSDNWRIRKISPDGIISTVAGNGQEGFSGDGGLATSARLYYPRSVTIGSDGTLYIADHWNHRVRKVSPDGIISTVAGSGQSANLYAGAFSGDGGLATSARLNWPYDVVASTDGTLYVADRTNNRIRNISPDGIITTIAGNGAAGFSGDGGSATSARLYYPEGVTIGNDGALYICDVRNHRIRKVSPSSQFQSLSETSVPSSNGSELYVFNTCGKHLRTLDAITGKPIWTFQYDETSGLLKSMADGFGDTTKIERNPNGQPTAIIAPHGERTTLTVDGNGYLNSITNPANETVSMTYTDKGMMTSFTDGENNRTNYAYDNLGRLTDQSNQQGGYTRMERQETANGFKVISRENKDGTDEYTTTYTIETLPDGTQKRTTVGCCGGAVESTTGTDGTETSRMPNGTVTVTKKGPDPRFGMLAPITTETKVTLPSGKSSITTRKRGAVMTDKNDPLSFTSIADTIIVDGAATITTYTKATRTIVTRSPMGKTVTTVLDTLGQVIKDSVAGMDPVSYSYDAKGQLIAVTQGTGANVRTSTITYFKGRAIKATDPLGQATSFGYDLAGRLTGKTLPDGQVISFDHNKNGAITVVTPPARGAHQFTYDAGSNLSQYTAPTIADGDNKTGYAYNKNGQITAVTRPDGLISFFEYDAIGRVSKVLMPSDTVAYVYDATSNHLTAVSNGESTISYTYDGSVLTKAQWSGAVNGSVGVRFNAKMQVDTQSVNDGHKIGFQYDNDGLLTKAGDLTIKRDGANGRLTGTAIGNLADTLIYSSTGDLATYQAKFNGADIFKTEITETDKLGRIVEKRETVDGVTDTYRYAYDAVGQLVEVRKNGSVVESYAYDANGNRLGTTVDGQDRLISANGVTYSYTANGELKTKTDATGTTTYEYDVMGHLVKTTVPNGTVLEDFYDMAGRILSRKVNGVVAKSYLWENQLRPTVELNTNNEVISRFVYATGINVPDYMVKDGVTYRLVKDHLGSVRAVVNAATGEVIQKISYDSFGKVVENTNPDFQPFGFAGGLYESKTGLVRFGARDYDANSGRWTDKEPLGFNAESNFYRYAKNDPVNFVDLTGNSALSKIRILADDIAHIIQRHINPRSDGTQWKNGLDDALENTNKNLRNPDRVTKQKNGNYLCETNMGKPVGAGGEEVVRTAVRPNGDVRTSFPANNYKKPGPGDTPIPLSEYFDRFLGLLDPFGIAGFMWNQTHPYELPDGGMI